MGSGANVSAMRLAKFVYAAQLVVPFLMPWAFFLGRIWLGAPGGWLSSVGLIMLGPPLAIVLGIPALISFRDRSAYRARAASRAYTTATLVCWGALLVAAMFVTEDSIDPPTSLVTAWTDRALDPIASQYLFFLAMMVAIAGWASAVWFAVSGLIESRRAGE